MHCDLSANKFNHEESTQISEALKVKIVIIGKFKYLWFPLQW